MRWKSYQTVNAIPIFAALLLTLAAVLRGAEYDEQYTLFLTAGNARPVWPADPFPAGYAAALQAGHATLAGIASDLRTTDVHPPLYFWAVALWRRLFGPGLLAARMLSVVCGIATIRLVLAIACSSAVERNTAARQSPAGWARTRGLPRRLLLPAMTALRSPPAAAICLGCYGFVYTNAIARGFALAGLLLCAGVLLLLRGRQTLAGLCFGAACATNYLAVFVAAATIPAARGWRAVPPMLPFLMLDTWFLAAQHGSRPGQFPPFEVWHGLLRIAGYQTAAVFGGLPLYLDGTARMLATIAIGLIACCTVIAVARSQPWRHTPVILAAALAPPAGLLVLSIASGTTPVELRYFAFGLPFAAILLSRTRVATPLLVLQAASIAGLLLSPRTMQPARALAAEAARLPAGAVVLVPNGNDGVGIAGAFATEAPPDLTIRVMRADDALPSAPVLALAPMAQDRESLAVIAAIRSQLGNGPWRRVAFRYNLELYERIVE